MTATLTALAGLKRDRPEWAPWLTVVEETLRDADAPVWAASVPVHDVQQITPPFLAGATVVVDAGTVQSLFGRLLRVAWQKGTPEMATLRSLRNAEPDMVTVFRASLCQDTMATAKTAASCGVDAGALQAVVALLSVPFLLACNQRWGATLPASWREGYCPVCGAWPVFAEARGIERKRFFRCGRCGGEWHARPLCCPFCGVDDHNALVSLVVEGALNAVIEGCGSCLGYVKTLTRLQGCPAGAVMLDDLASVHLDVAALHQGYKRPEGAGHPLDVTVTGKESPRRLFAWKG